MKKDFDWAMKTTENKKKLDCSLVEFLIMDEGLCIQPMHIGPYDTEPETIVKMDEDLAQNGYVKDIGNERFHHEIYLSDPRKSILEKMKTVIRYPIKKL